MKNIIIIAFSVILGIYIFTLILGDGDSIRVAGKDVMKLQVQQMRVIP